MKNPQAMLTHRIREKRRFIPWENLSAWVLQEENSNLNLCLSLDWVFYRWLEVLNSKQEKSKWSYGFYSRVWQRDIWWFGHLWCHFVGPCNLTKTKLDTGSYYCFKCNYVKSKQKRNIWKLRQGRPCFCHVMFSIHR